MPDRAQHPTFDVIDRVALNTAQAEAAAYPGRHALVLAGAVSGKTRVLIHRIVTMRWINETALTGGGEPV